MDRIGGFRKEPRSRIGGDDEDMESMDESEAEPMDARAEAGARLFRLLGVPPEQRARAAEALKTFIIACEE